MEKKKKKMKTWVKVILILLILIFGVPMVSCSGYLLRYYLSGVKSADFGENESDIPYSSIDVPIELWLSEKEACELAEEFGVYELFYVLDEDFKMSEGAYSTPAKSNKLDKHPGYETSFEDVNGRTWNFYAMTKDMYLFVMDDLNRDVHVAFVSNMNIGIFNYQYLIYIPLDESFVTEKGYEIRVIDTLITEDFRNNFAMESPAGEEESTVDEATGNLSVTEYVGKWETIDESSGMSNFMTIGQNTDTSVYISFECDLIPYGEDDYTMTGVLNNEILVYNDCTKIYDSHGNTVENQVEYTNGSGQLYFRDGNLILEVFEHYELEGDVVKTFVFHRIG